MLGLKSKTLSLPHLSLSRNSSPARQGSTSRDSSPVHSPLSSAPSSGSLAGAGERDVSPPTSTSTSPRLSVKRVKSTSPKMKPLDTLPGEAKEVKENKSGAPVSRRQSFGASLAAFTTSALSGSSPSSSTVALPSGAPKSPSVPAGLTITPATSAHGTTLASGRSTSDDRSGLRPLRTLSARGKTRSKSSDRALDAIEQPGAMGPPQVVPKEKKGGMMGPIRRGLALSQNGAPRSSSVPPLGSPALPASGAASPVLGGSGAATPAQAYAAANGATTVPVPAAPSGVVGHASGPTGVQLHQLAESYVGKVSLRLGEAVNKVFLPIPNGPGGIPNKEMERAEAPYGGSGAAWKGRPAPRVFRSREVGEMIAAELQAALHDVYLLRTLLRSSVLKALSLFLTRLSALLLVPSVSDPSLHPSLFTPPSTTKEADSLPLPLRYNFQIVRCAYEVKRALAVVADPAAGFPHFVEDTLRPWRIKLGELMGRVMSPLVGSARLAVAEICERARIEGAAAGGNDHASSALGLNGLHAPTPVKHTATSQLRSLSLGRGTASPSASGTSTPVPAAAASNGNAAGPTWLRDLTAHLDAFARLVARLDCRSDADKWLVSVATATVWKGMLNCSARVVGAVGVAGCGGAGAGEKGFMEGEKVPPTPSTAGKKGFLGGVTAKKTPSPPLSPALPVVDLFASGGATPAPSASARLAYGGSNTTSTGPSAADIAFVRLISDLELLEARLQAFLSSSLSSASAVLAPAAPPSSACPGGPSCGLCRTGRAFDPESEDSDSEDDDEPHQHGGHGFGKRVDPGRESRLALSAMREAMQALSALVVVVRACKDVGVIKAALETEPVKQEEMQQQERATETKKPMTPSAMFALATAAPSVSTTASSSSSAITVLPPSSALSPSCPTIHSALLELPPLILLHVLASRLPCTLLPSFRLPHVLWSLRGGWSEYASELRGFAAGEEWAPEVAWEMGGEVERVWAEKEIGGLGWNAGEKEACEALLVAVKRAGGGSAAAGKN
ncbi:hypothetical protein JCM11251_001999 [Rhodosporidiobolus azoricus]